jgi:crotonobetainyl-CoA:carnitine CoA-transferase CaiB-like acyl-CoA transferase
MDSSRKGPLSGLKILDLTQFVSGPFCTQILSDLGARVVKIERPVSGDPYRQAGPSFVDGESTLFLSLNRGKESIDLNLKCDEGRTIFLKKLVPNFDVIVENFTPGTMESLGLGYESCSKENPEIIYSNISGFGNKGPYKEKKGFDLILQGVTGIMDLTGERGSVPVKVGIPLTDFAAGLFSAVGILSSVYESRSSAKGSKISTSLYESSVSLLSILACDYLASGKVPHRMGSASQTFAPYQAFKAKDAYITVAGAGSEEMWLRFVKAIEMPHLTSDPRFALNSDRVINQEKLAEIINRRLVERGAEDWLRIFDSFGVPCGLVGTLPDVIDSDQTKALQLISEIPLHGSSSGKTFKAVRLPLSIDENPIDPRVHPPSLGEHTISVLSEVGVSEEEIQSLKSRHVIS